MSLILGLRDLPWTPYLTDVPVASITVPSGIVAVTVCKFLMTTGLSNLTSTLPEKILENF